MASISFSAGTTITSAWANDVDYLTYDIFNGLSAVPSTGKLFRSNGTNMIATTSTFADTYGVSTLLYASSANVVSGLATANSSILTTDGSGVPSWVAYTGTGAPVRATSPTITTPTITSPIVTNPDNTTQALSWTSGGTTAWDASLGAIATVTASSGNTTFGAPTNLKKGTMILKFTQDSTPRTITWNAVFKWSGGVAPTLSTGSGDVDIISFYCDGTNLYGVIQNDFS